jgi:peroxiredoxin
MLNRECVTGRVPNPQVSPSKGFLSGRVRSHCVGKRARRTGARQSSHGARPTLKERIVMNGLKSILLGALLSVFAATTLAASGLSGQLAPDFVLKSSSGDNLRLSEFRGDVVMINFWATWCGPCRQEMPLLDELYSRYQRVGFSLLGVNIDDDSRRAMQMIDDLGVSFPVLFDEAREVSRLYQVEAMPVTVLVDRDGNVRHIHHGYKPGYEEKYLTEIRSLLRE